MTHGYPLTSLYGDYLRAAIGAACLGTPFYFSIGNPIAATIFGSMTLLFVVFGLRTLLRHLTVIEITPEAIAMIGPFGRRIAWNDVGKVDLKFYSTHRDRKSDGWLQLKVYGGGGCLKLESSLRGFDDIAARVATAAFGNGAEMTESTIENFTAMGVTVDFPEEDTG